MMKTVAQARDWRGSLFLREQHLLYAGPVASTDLHAHHAFQIVWARDAPVRIRTASDSREVTSAVIAPDVPHAFDSSAPRVLLLYIDPEAEAGRRLRSLVHAEMVEWPTHGSTMIRASWPTTLLEADALTETILTHLLGEQAKPSMRHPAIVRLLRQLPSLLTGDLRLPALARATGISQGRLSHLFKQEVGIPLRPYVRWMRLRAAAVELSRGANLTDAAHVAGFADSAHLTRTFRSMFGIVPSEIHYVADWHVEGG